jgi:hypothetical protein
MRSVLIGLVAAAVSWGSATSAAVVLFTDKSAFDAAVTTTVTSDFEGIAPADSLVGGDTLTVDGVVYDGVGNTRATSTVICDASSRCAGSPYDSSVLFANFADPLDILVTGLGAPVTAIGGIFGDLDGSTNASATISVFGPSDNLLANYNVSVGSMGAGFAKTFFGVATENGDAITRIRYTLNGDDRRWAAVDDMQFATSVAVIPLPTTLPMALAGLGMLALMSRRRVRPVA